MTSIDKTSLATVLAISAALLAGCDRHDGVRVCNDGYGRRLPDDDCRTTGHAGTGWIYIRSGNAPAVGQAITEGERTPDGDTHYGAAPEGGISRGGFGGTGEGFGGGEGGGGEGGAHGGGGGE